LGYGSIEGGSLQRIFVLEMRIETFNTFNHGQFVGPTLVNANINSSMPILSLTASRIRCLQPRYR